ncbi:hypothetical protein Salat_0181200 [Sesamum alatum]|uniref:Replication factor A C-terminal domain-containing protein n=1 Tax=Sesamum alatum TaxID=300844 RepID=A0AAE2CY80_9LAMI|nr:hypothetical protein Salat_0181200 [Sesamum alatum]
MVENKSSPWYDSCKKCSKTVIFTENGIECRQCTNKVIEASPRFRLTLMVSSTEEIAKVTVFEEAATVYVGCSVSDYIKSTIEVAASNYIRHLETTENKEYKFLFKLDRNIETINGSISIIAEAIERLEEPNAKSQDTDEQTKQSKQNDLENAVIKKSKQHNTSKTQTNEVGTDLLSVGTAEKKARGRKPKKIKEDIDAQNSELSMDLLSVGTPEKKPRGRKPKKIKEDIDGIKTQNNELSMDLLSIGTPEKKARGRKPKKIKEEIDCIKTPAKQNTTRQPIRKTNHQEVIEIEYDETLTNFIKTRNVAKKDDTNKVTPINKKIKKNC